MGFVMLGIATLTDFGINAAVFGMVAHGLITGMLFFIAGSVQERYGTREMSRLGGMLIQMPRMGWIPSSARWRRRPGGSPGSGRVPRDPLRLRPHPAQRARRRRSGTLWTFRTYMVIAAIGTVLAAGYLLWMLQRAVMGSVKPEFERLHVHDVPARSGSRTPLLLLIVVLGVYPNLIFKVTDPAVVKVVTEVTRRVSG